MECIFTEKSEKLFHSIKPYVFAQRTDAANMNKLLTEIQPFCIMNGKSHTVILERMCSFENNHQEHGL